jgi:hypothetical protein
MFIITIGKDSKISADMLARLKRIHETPQDPVVVVNSDITLPDGYAVTRYDGFVKDFVNENPRLAEEADVKKQLHKQNERLSKTKYINL